MFIQYNANPFGLDVEDCVIRAISTALNYNWYMVHDELSYLSRKMADIPSSNRVWKKYLYDKGYSEYKVENICPRCYSVKQFCNEHPRGTYILSTCQYTKDMGICVTGMHVLTVIDGSYYDTSDSGEDVPLSFFVIR